MPSSNPVHVVAAVIKNHAGQIFIAKRPENVHQGGLWEFPGGKLEKGESVLQALRRELLEEVGITISDATPLIRIRHHYEDKSVLLDVWCVNKFTGEAHGKEGQDTCWVELEKLSSYEFPEANIPIIKALNLPDKYMITGQFDNEEILLAKVKSAIENGIRLVQFRAPGLDSNTYFNLARKLFEICLTQNARLLLNTTFNNYEHYKAKKFSHGLHLNSKELKRFSAGKNIDFMTSTSVHSFKELRSAEDKKIDFVILSPVKKTVSHPQSVPLGWETFREYTEATNLPVYALGGMCEKDIELARQFGGQGISAIGAFWNT